VEAVGEWGEGLREGARIIVDLADCIGDHLGHRLRILMIAEEVCSDDRGTGDGQTVEIDPLGLAQVTAVETDVRPPRLLSRPERELVRC